MKIHFSKYHGTGNDFIIVDNRSDEYSTLSTNQVNFLCDRKFGIGADGLMMLENAEGFDFRMRYFNADGKEGSMCGNGGRCLIQFAKDNGIVKNDYHFIATDGTHEASIQSNGLIKLKMQDVEGVAEDRHAKILNTGSPHFIQYVENIDALDVYREGKAIRYNDRYKQEGINVNFVQLLPDGIRIRTYERGVENETLSCGTGATASALATAEKDGIQTTKVKVEGGELSIAFNKTGDQHFTDIWLIGPAQFVYKGTIEI
jgi:diaminopimelate epimerase